MHGVWFSLDLRGDDFSLVSDLNIDTFLVSEEQDIHGAFLTWLIFTFHRLECFQSAR